MPITPLDIRKKTFASQLRGLSAKEVKSFLDLVAKEVEGLRKERGLLAEKVDELSAQLETHQRTEKLLKETLLTAQKTSGELRQAAEQEARAVLAKAEQDAREEVRVAKEEAARLVREAEEQGRRLRDRLAELESRRSALLDQIRGIGHSCHSLVERWNQDETGHHED